MVGDVSRTHPKEHAMSPLTEALVINAVVLAATLEADLGPHRKVGKFRIVRPLLTVALVIPLFLQSPVTRGNGLLVELVGVGAGLLGGLLVSVLMRVYRSPQTGRPASATSWPYALVWAVIVGARAAFSYGSVHWFPAQIDAWCVAHQVTAAAITDGLIFMAIAMVAVRTLSLGARARRLPAASRVQLATA
jgi:hypothetical protein